MMKEMFNMTRDELIAKVNKTEEQNAALVEALEEINKAEGPYSRNRLTHAEATIAHMVLVASQALALAEGDKDVRDNKQST